MIGPKFYAWGRDGNPLAFGKLYTYQARTNAPKDTYQSEDGVVANTNPVILNGEGYANIYLDGSYKVVLKDKDENEIWSADPVSASMAEEWINCLTATYLSSNSFKVNGNFISEYQEGRNVRINNNTVNYSYSTIVSSTFAANETTIVIADPIVTTGVSEVCSSIVSPESLPIQFVLINDLSQAYIFDTEDDFKSSAIVLPEGKTIHLNDRNADFTKVTGTDTANTANVIASNIVNQSIELKANQYLSSQWGVTGDGVTVDNVAMALLDLAATNNDVTIVGTVLFTGANLLNTANYLFTEGSSIVDVRGQQIVMLDSDNKTVVGLQHNHLLEDETTLGSNLPQTSGNINPAPKVIPFRAGSVDIMAYWYQDFGLDYTRQGNGINGGLTWYYWKWNLATNTGDGVTTVAYNEDRRPLLGYYRGDDSNVMDWQCYWLAKYGCTGTIIQQRSNTGEEGYPNLTSTWNQTNDVNHWMYKLFNDVPNFSALQYQLWGFTKFLADTSTNRKVYIDSWTDVIENIYLKYSNFHYIKKGNKIYPVMFLFEANSIRTTFGNNASDKEAKDFMIDMANLFVNAGYDGLALMCRNPTASFVGDGYLEANNVLYYDAEYSRIKSSGDIANYKGYAVDGLDFSANDRIRGINNTVTSRQYVYPHPSVSFNTAGNTPDLFRQAVTKGINQISASDAPNILSIYNVSEWAEGGAALQPNIQDGFAYMEALSDGIRGGKQEQSKKMRSVRGLWKAASVGSQRFQNLSSSWADTIEVYVDYSTDEISDPARLPNIYNGFEGDRVQIRCVGSHTLRLVDDIVTLGTNIKLAHLGGAASKLLLAPNQTADFIFDSDLSLWVCSGTTGTPA